jgi:hypothetical protein
MKNLDKKTPIKYAIDVDDLSGWQSNVWKEWTDEEKLEYARYLDRDSGRQAIKVFIFLLFVFGFLMWFGFNNPF